MSGVIARDKASERALGGGVWLEVRNVVTGREIERPIPSAAPTPPRALAPPFLTKLASFVYSVSMNLN